MKIAEKKSTLTFSVLRDKKDKITVALNNNSMDELANRAKALNFISVDINS